MADSTDNRDVEPIDVDAQDDDDLAQTASRSVKVEDDDEYVPEASPMPRSSRRTVTAHFVTTDEEEEKKKPILKLEFNSFSPRIALCVVVEPWPPLPTRRRQASVLSIGGVRAMSRATSDAPPVLVPQGAREQTPLFLPDFDRDTATPAPMSFFRQPSMPVMPSFNEAMPAEEDEEEAPPDLMQFTQALQATDTARGGSPEEQFADDEVLYGDADEVRTGH